MKIFFFPIYLSLLSFLKSELFCEKLILSYETEDSLIDVMNKNLHTYNNDLGCIEIFLRKGLYKALNVFLEEMKNREVKFRETLKIAINKLQRKNEELHNKFRFDESEFQTVSPAFMWSQSLKEIFIQIKLAHRHDSPGCLELKNQETKVDLNKVYFQGYCVQGDIPIRFELNIDLHDEVLNNEATINSGSVGRITIIIPKKHSPKYWRTIYKEGVSAPSNMKTWIEMNEKYESEIGPYREEEEEQIENSKRNKNKGKRRKKKSQSTKRDL